MSGHEFLLPDELGWKCNDELNQLLEDWSKKMSGYAKDAGTFGEFKQLMEVGKAELIDDFYAIIKKYQAKIKT